MRRKRRKAAASRPILSMSSGSFVRMRGGIQPNRPSDMGSGRLVSPEVVFDFGFVDDLCWGVNDERGYGECGGRRTLFLGRRTLEAKMVTT